MNNCDKFQQNFSSYIDGELPSNSRKHLEGHLELCPECEETLSRMTRLRESLLRLPRLKTSPEFEHKLRQHLGYGPPLTTVQYPVRQFSWKYPAIGFAIVFFIAGFFMIYTPSHTDVDLNSPTESSFSPNIPGQTIQKREVEHISPAVQSRKSSSETDSLYQENDLQSGSNNSLKLIKENKKQ